MSIEPSVYSMMTNVSQTYTCLGDVGFAELTGISITGVLVIDATSRALAFVANKNVVRMTTSDNKNLFIVMRYIVNIDLSIFLLSFWI